MDGFRYTELRPNDLILSVWADTFQVVISLDNTGDSITCFFNYIDISPRKFGTIHRVPAYLDDYLPARSFEVYRDGKRIF